LRKFSKRAKFWQFSGPGSQWLEKVLIFTAKGTSTGRAKKSNPLGKIRYLWNC